MRIPDKSFIDKLKGFNDEMTISQVVRFFERFGLSLTKTMIQNYVRVEVLPPPRDKRYYTKKHLLLLYIIDDLKNVYSLDEIKRAFMPVLSTFGSSDDMFMVYRCYSQFYENYMLEYNAGLESLKAEIDKLPGGGDIKNFLLILSLMTQTSASKNIAVDNLNS